MLVCCGPQIPWKKLYIYIYIGTYGLDRFRKVLYYGMYFPLNWYRIDVRIIPWDSPKCDKSLRECYCMNYRHVLWRIYGMAFLLEWESHLCGPINKCYASTKKIKLRLIIWKTQDKEDKELRWTRTQRWTLLVGVRNELAEIQKELVNMKAFLVTLTEKVLDQKVRKLGCQVWGT